MCCDSKRVALLHSLLFGVACARIDVDRELGSSAWIDCAVDDGAGLQDIAGRHQEEPLRGMNLSRIGLPAHRGALGHMSPHALAIGQPPAMPAAVLVILEQGEQVAATAGEEQEVRLMGLPPYAMGIGRQTGIGSLCP